MKSKYIVMQIVLNDNYIIILFKIKMLNTMRSNYPHTLFVLGMLLTLICRSNSLTSAPIISPTLKFINICTHLLI